MFYGLFGLIVLVLDILAIIQVIQSAMDSTKKLIWILVILFLPLLGMVLWFTIGKNSP